MLGWIQEFFKVGVQPLILVFRGGWVPPLKMCYFYIFLAKFSDWGGGGCSSPSGSTTGFDTNPDSRASCNKYSVHSKEITHSRIHTCQLRCKRIIILEKFFFVVQCIHNIRFHSFASSRCVLVLELSCSPDHRLESIFLKIVCLSFCLHATLTLLITSKLQDRLYIWWIERIMPVCHC